MHPIWLSGVEPSICDEIIVLLFGECSPSAILPTNDVGIVTFDILFNSLANVLWSDVIELLACDGINPISTEWK